MNHYYVVYTGKVKDDTFKGFAHVSCEHDISNFDDVIKLAEDLRVDSNWDSLVIENWKPLRGE